MLSVSNCMTIILTALYYYVYYYHYNILSLRMLCIVLSTDVSPTIQFKYITHLSYIYPTKSLSW